MKKLITVLSMTVFFALGASACGGDLVKKIDKLADEACACKDMACAEKVQGKLMDLVKDAKEPSKGDQEKIMKSMERMGECMAKLAIPGDVPAAGGE
jgi:hypothetical protein